MEFEFYLEDKIHKVSVELKDGLYQVALGEENYQVDCCPISSNCFSILIGEKAYTVFIADNLEEKCIALKGEQYMLKKTSHEDQPKYASSAGILNSNGLISTPMPGKIVKVLVSKGEVVEKGQSLIIVESMKMENNIYSPFKAKIAKINVSPGELAQPGEALLDLEKI